MNEVIHMPKITVEAETESGILEALEASSEESLPPEITEIGEVLQSVIEGLEKVTEQDERGRSKKIVARRAGGKAEEIYEGEEEGGFKFRCLLKILETFGLAEQPQGNRWRAARD